MRRFMVRRDGVLVHFLERESVKIYRCSAVKAAVEMLWATACCVEELRRFLRTDSKLLGGGVGIDVGDAHWSVDHRDNPIVVGRGVVGACRLSGPTEAGRMTLMNIVRQELDEVTRNRLKLQWVSLKVKGAADEMSLRYWQSMAKPEQIVGEEAGRTIREMCKKMVAEE